MTVVLFIILTLFFIIILYLINRLRKYDVQKTCDLTARGSYMTFIYDKKLNIIDIINPQSDIMLAKNVDALIGLNVRKLESVMSENNQQEAKIITDNIVEASETKSDIFFEYTTVNNDGTTTQTLCYAEYQNDGSILNHAIKMDAAKRVKGCGKCDDYILAVAMNNLAVGLYTKHIDKHKEYIFANNVVKTFYQCDDITQSPYWDQEAEDEADSKVIEGNGILSYDKVTYDEQGMLHRWFNLSKNLQRMGARGDYIITTVTDISEQKRRAKELEEAKLFLGMAIGASDIIVWRYNIKEKRFHSLYGELALIKGLSVEEFIAMVQQDYVGLCHETYENIITQKSKSETIVIGLLNPRTQAYQYVNSVVTSTLSANGNVENIIGTYKDITATQLKEIELKNMRNSLDMAIVAGDIMAWEFDLETEKLSILYGNDSVDQCNKDIEKLPTEDAMKIHIHQTDTEKYREFIDNIIIKGDKDSITIRGIDIENGTSYYEIIVSPIKDKNNIVTKLIGTRRNISDSENQKITLEKTQKNLTLAMEAGGVSVWIYDIAKETFFTLQGDTIAGDGLTMQDNLTMLHPDDAIVCQELIDALATGKITHGSTIYRYKANDIEGGYRYYEARKIAVKENGGIKYLTGTQKEVTTEQFYKQTLEESNFKTQQALCELQQSNKYNKLILNNSNSGLIYLTPDYVVRWENISLSSNKNKFTEGYKTGNVCYKAVKGLDSPCSDCIMTQAITEKQRIRKELTLDNGKVIDVIAIPVLDDNNDIEGVVIRADDVTQLRKSYNELQIAKEKAERSDRFKSTFLANMSHEIRTPLNAIVGFSELITEVDTEEEKREYGKIIATNNELLLKLINDILDLSKMEAGFINIKNMNFDLSELYNELSTTFTQRMTSGVEFICDNPYPSCFVNLDRNRLTQVITNFVTNAMKFTKEGYIKIGYEWIEKGLKIYVTDTGIGISPENTATVFDRFEKLNDFAQGTGLGLSICKSIIEAENGTIGVDSKLGVGSTFWAVIPCETVDCNIDQENVIDVQMHENHKQTATKKTILIAEDTDSNYILINAMLRQQYDLTRVVNGELAVNAVKNNNYDIVLMDIKMPVMNGIEATQKIREFNTTIPIIALTANVFDSDRKSAIDAGCNDFFTKPIDKIRLLNFLEQV